MNEIVKGATKRKGRKKERMNDREKKRITKNRKKERGKEIKKEHLYCTIQNDWTPAQSGPPILE